MTNTRISLITVMLAVIGMCADSYCSKANEVEMNRATPENSLNDFYRATLARFSSELSNLNNPNNDAQINQASPDNGMNDYYLNHILNGADGNNNTSDEMRKLFDEMRKEQEHQEKIEEEARLINQYLRQNNWSSGRFLP